MTTTQNILLCFVNDTNGTNYQNFSDSCLNNFTKPEPPIPSYIVPVDGEVTNKTVVKNTNETLWVLVSVADGMNQDKNIDVLKDAANFSDSRVFGLIFLSKFYPR